MSSGSAVNLPSVNNMEARCTAFLFLGSYVMGKSAFSEALLYFCRTLLRQLIVDSPPAGLCEYKRAHLLFGAQTN